MLENSMGVVRLSEVANYKKEGLSGWVVRERTTSSGSSLLDYGCYIADGVFLSVPMASAFKNKLVPIAVQDEEFNFYVIPKEMQFAVKKFTNKKGKVCPMLIPVTEDQPAVLISSLAVDCGAESIVNVEVSDGSLVLAKYIDKNRKAIGIIAFNTDTGLINPSTGIKIEKAVLGQKQMSVVNYTFHTAGIETSTDVVEINEPAATKFIKLNSYIIPAKNDAKKDAKNDEAKSAESAE